MRFQVFSFESEKVLQWQEDINVVVINAPSSTNLCLSFWNVNF